MNANNNQENQQDTIPPELELNLTAATDKKENPFVAACKLPAIEYKLQQLLGVNPKTWYELKDKGILPPVGTYGEYLVAIFQHYRSKNEAAIAKARLNAAKNGIIDPEIEFNNLSRLLEAEKVQKIRLDRAREQEIHLRNLTTRNALLDRQELYALIAPLLGNIVNVLRNAADENPDLQEIVDNCFNSLFVVGEKLVEQADADKLDYVQHMLDSPLNLSSIIDTESVEE